MVRKYLGDKSNPRITTKIPTDRKLDVVAKVSDKRKAKVRTTSTSKNYN